MGSYVWWIEYQRNVTLIHNDVRLTVNQLIFLVNMNESNSIHADPKGRHDDYEEGEIPSDFEDMVYQKEGM